MNRRTQGHSANCVVLRDFHYRWQGTQDTDPALPAGFYFPSVTNYCKYSKDTVHQYKT